MGELVELETLIGRDPMKALDLCMSAFNGFDNFMTQQGTAVPTSEVVTLADVARRIRIAQAAVLLVADIPSFADAPDTSDHTLKGDL